MPFLQRIPGPQRFPSAGKSLYVWRHQTIAGAGPGHQTRRAARPRRRNTYHHDLTPCFVDVAGTGAGGARRAGRCCRAYRAFRPAFHPAVRGARLRAYQGQRLPARDRAGDRRRKNRNRHHRPQPRGPHLRQHHRGDGAHGPDAGPRDPGVQRAGLGQHQRHARCGRHQDLARAGRAQRCDRARSGAVRAGQGAARPGGQPRPRARPEDAARHHL